MLKLIKEKTKNKSITLINIFLIAILAVIAVYAWFTTAADNRVDSYDIEVVTDDALQLSFDEATWNSKLDLNDFVYNGSNVMAGLNLVNVTSSGNGFLIPPLTQYDNYAVVDNTKDWTTATKNVNYLDFTVYMRSKDQLKVYFSSDSTASPVSTVVTGADCGNKSSYGDFSKDCIVGALRVGVYTGTSTSPNCAFTWIPKPEYHLTNEVGSDTYSMDTSSTSGKYSSGTNQYAWNDSYVHYYYPSKGVPLMSTTTKLYTGDKNSPSGTTLPKTVNNVPTETDTLVATLSGTADSEGYYYGNFMVRIWIEGCDTEARRALVNGKFNLSLALDSFEISS